MNNDRYKMACDLADGWREKYEDAKQQLIKAHQIIDKQEKQLKEPQMNENAYKAMTQGVFPDELEEAMYEPLSTPVFGKTVPETKPDAPAKGFTEIRRDRVFAAIDSERVYQELKWGTLEEHPQSVGAYLMLMHIHLTRAAEAWAGADNDEAALEGIRKVLAIGVACGAQHGLPNRDYSSVNYGDS